MNTDYPQHTPELARLFAALTAANATVKKVSRKIGLSAVRSPEYKAAMVAYRAYWDAVDADKAASKPAAPV